MGGRIELTAVYIKIHQERIDMFLEYMKMTNKKNLVDRDVFGTPKNRSKTWDVKKSRDPKKDRRKIKKDLDDKNKTTL